ncbi:protein of unknown function [Methanoculleus bourgensis]|uniref:Uncharacterized protein n=1 Tax=Methanoculleus bourgensis TaxID=83986 RepID=A0A0X3BK27_9EURY|nr:protein of unknown function [Methanoculleus bourgensis]
MVEGEEVLIGNQPFLEENRITIRRRRKTG